MPYPAGGPTDETARMVAQSLSAQLKQSFIVEDIGGGGSIIGSEKVARATPDGYTLLVHNLQIAANVSLYQSLPFDTVNAFTPVMLINRNPLVLVGRKTLEPNTLRDLVGVKGPSRAWTLRDALQRIAQEGSGVIVILRAREEPRELVQAMQALAISGGQTIPAGQSITGLMEPRPAGAVLRTYGVGAQILKDLGVRRMRVLSAPKLLQGISAFDLEIEGYVDEES